MSDCKLHCNYDELYTSTYQETERKNAEEKQMDYCKFEEHI